MKRLTPSYAYALVSAFLLIFLAYSCDQADVMPAGDDSGQILRITADDPMEAGPDGMVLVTKELPNSGGLEMVFYYPDMQTYKVMVAKSDIIYNMNHFRFIADISRKVGVADQQVKEIEFRNFITGFVAGEIFKPIGTNGLFARGIPADETSNLPQIEIRSASYAELQSSVLIPDTIIHIPSNCPPTATGADCGGPCAFTFIYDNETVVHTGECVKEVSCYCKSKKRTVIKHGAVVVPGDN